jgi:hypothetical protein
MELQQSRRSRSVNDFGARAQGSIRGRDAVRRGVTRKQIAALRTQRVIVRVRRGPVGRHDVRAADPGGATSEIVVARAQPTPSERYDFHDA